jgi:hypothetical protein
VDGAERVDVVYKLVALADAVRRHAGISCLFTVVLGTLDINFLCA